MSMQVLMHPWLRDDHHHFKKEKKLTEVSECRKRTTISSHKSKEKEQTPMNATGNVRKLTETCQENLKLELRIIRQSPLKLNSTYTHRKEREAVSKQLREKPKKDPVKCNVKVLDLLKAGLKREDKSKSKSRRF
jgi:hypothetical protein